MLYRLNHWFQASVIAATVAVVSAPVAVAQQKAQPAAQPAAKTNPLGATSSGGWKSKIDGSTGSVTGKAFDPEQLKQIDKVNTYFNAMGDLQGRFIQSTSDNQRSKGRFFVKRPGRFRFNYASPSQLVILSDGRFLSVEDHDLNTVDRYPLDSTPFRILLAPKVDILRDAQVIDMFSGAELLALTLRDRKGGDAPGTMKLFFKQDPEGKISLKEWIITDAQGIDTRIQVAKLIEGQKVDPAMFRGSKMDFNLQGNN